MRSSSKSAKFKPFSMSNFLIYSAFMASPVKQRVQAFEKHAVTAMMTPEKAKTASTASKYVN